MKKAFTMAYDWASEAARVPSLSQMDDWFSSFIKAYEGKRMPDTDGVSVVPRYYPIPTDRFTTSISKSSSSSQHTIKVVSLMVSYRQTSSKKAWH